MAAQGFRTSQSLLGLTAITSDGHRAGSVGGAEFPQTEDVGWHSSAVTFGAVG